MKKLKLLTIMCILFSLTTYAQERNCGTMEDLANRMKKDSGLSKRMSDIEIFTQQKVKKLEKSSKTIEGDIITIPVVVHVLSSTTSENISKAIIDAQINVLNQDFRRTNSDRDNTWSQAADSQIEFCLARVDPNGNATNGVTRKQTTQKDWQQLRNNMKITANGGVDAWDTSEYLNIWVVPNIKSGTLDILGYAQFPGGAAATDGIVIGHRYFGTTGSNAVAPFNLGRTTTHEVGHFLNLRHIWGDGVCGVDDFVADTPESDESNRGCTPTHSSCGTVDMVQNFMDYSDDSCMNLFTEGQKNRMRSVLLSGGTRSSLALSNRCQPPTQPTCNDNIQNGNETGIDCGGSSCSPCQTNNQYCESKGNDSSGEHISRVQIGNINRTSGASSYSDFTSTSTNLSTNSSVTITITPTWSGRTFAEAYAVWIDYNKDGIFSNTNERVWSKSASTDTPVSGTFTVPSNASTGTTRLRVAMKYNGIPTPCESFSFGEVEDYTVNITTTTNTSTCNDNIQNGNETGVDCGGSCTPCSTGNNRCAGVPAYDRNASYSTGDRVVHNNALYERRANGGWTNLGSCDSARSKDLTTNFTISPNPLTSNLLTLSSTTIEDVSYTITNTLGQTVKKGILKDINTLDVGSLKVGLYLVQFSSKSKSTTTIKKFIKR